MDNNEKYNLGDALNIFFTESREMLEDMEACLLALEKDASDENSINAMFRAAHTIKGSSSMFGLSIIEEFTHAVENLLDETRKKTLTINSEIISLLLECHDFILTLLNNFEKQNDYILDDELNNKYSELLEKVKSYSGEKIKVETADSGSVNKHEFESDLNEENHVKNDCWHISLRFGADTFKDGLDPQSFISYLADTGKIVNIETVYDRIPPAPEMDPESCYLGFEINFKGNTTKAKLEDIFDFIKDDCKIRIMPPNSNISEYVALIHDLNEEPMLIGEILKKSGSLTESELEEALKLQHKIENERKDEKTEKPRIGKILIDEQMIQMPVVNAAIERQSNIKKSIRVDAEKLDDLINLVGELVITGSNIKQVSEKSTDGELHDAISSMSRLIDDIRNRTMSVRMVQIGDTFRRFERVVRDLCQKNGKEIDLIIKGGETELDKTLIEKITDPLMHLIRNAVDHGIGTRENRLASGKSGRGTIILNAYHETGSIIIEVSDDGNGINREKIIHKAVELGMLQENKINDITENEITSFMFEPGFSTAEKLTNISGRGVGLDVVKRNIETMKGSVTITSREGEGTKFTIHLPLTLAIIDGFMFAVEDLFYILPLDMVCECAEISNEDIKGMDSGNYINLRGEVLPFLNMREFFSEKGAIPKRQNIIVIEYAKNKIALVVDKLLGEFQTVIKPVGKMFNKLKWISGATILGTGDVALILDVPSLINQIKKYDKEKAVI